MSTTVTDTIEFTSPSAAVLTVERVQTPILADDGFTEAPSRPDQPVLTKGTTAIIFASITGVTTISSLLSGLVTVVLPIMARDLNLSESVLLW